MSTSRLWLNPTKTQTMWLGSSQQGSRVNITNLPILSTAVKITESPRNLGAVIDTEMAAHVTVLCQTSFFQLRHLRPVARSTTLEAAKTLVHALILSSWLLQLAVVRSVWLPYAKSAVSTERRCTPRYRFKTARSHHTSVAPASLAIPVHRWVQFKIACLVHQALWAKQRGILAVDIQLISEGCRRLRSTSDSICAVPRTHNTFGDGSFAAAGVTGACQWNSLPSLYTSAMQDLSYREFKRQLKTFYLTTDCGATPWKICW